MEFNTDMFIAFLTIASLIFFLIIILLDVLCKKNYEIRTFEDKHRLREQLYYGILIYNGLSLILVIISLYFKHK